MKKKKLIGIVLAVALVLSVCAAVYAAEDDFTMTYLPGTSDKVTNMPPADSGTGGQAYTVSGEIPQREGYEFIDWTLDYGVANTYTLNYQVTGDPAYGIPGDTATPGPVTGIREGSSVTLANALTTAWETADGSPAPTTADYEVNYLEAGTEKVLNTPKNVAGIPIGSVVTEVAIYIDGYELEGDDLQERTIKQEMIGKWTFTGWCSDEACTTPVTEITGIGADTTVYGRWVYSETYNRNEFTFYYRVQYTYYDVRYIDRTTGAEIAPSKTVDHQKVGDTVIEVAVASDNYDLDDDSEKSLSLQEGGNEIIFYYKPAVTTYTVRYVDVTFGEYKDIIEPEIGTGNVGSTVIKTRIRFDGYNLQSSSKITRTLSRNEEDNVFIFEYLRLD